MPIEAVKLTEKKDVKKSTTSYAINISTREASICDMIGRPVIKILNPVTKELTVKAKALTVDESLIDATCGKREKMSDAEFEKDLARLPVEVLVDLVLIMYIGQELNADMESAPGEDRFLAYFAQHKSLVNRKSEKDLAKALVNKVPVIRCLRDGYEILHLPKGADLCKWMHARGR